MRRLIPAALAISFLCACGSDPGRVLVTADWLSRSLTLFDHGRLVEGADADASIVRRIDLSAHAPGPLELEITPDGAKAVIAVSPGFFGGLFGTFIGSPEVQPGGGLLIVDLVTGKVEAEIETLHVPMGIAISPGGTRAFTANFGDDAAPGSSISVIDLERREVIREMEVEAGAEQIAISKDGGSGIASVGGGSIRGFDPVGLAFSEPLRVSADPGGVAFIGETRRALVANSVGPAGYSIVDLSDPLAPSVIETVELEGGIPFGACAVPGTSRVLVTIGGVEPALIAHIDASGPVSVIERVVHLGNHAKNGFPLGAAADGAGFAFVTIPGDASLSLLDLAGGSVRSTSWLEAPGATWAALSPRPLP